MSSRSALPRSDGGAQSDAAPADLQWSDPWLEHLTGVRSSKRTFYAEWRHKCHGLDRAIEALKAISAALCTTTRGPQTLCDAVVEALAQHFGAPTVAMTLARQRMFTGELPAIISWPSEAGQSARIPAELGELEERVRSERRPVTAAGQAGTGVGSGAGIGVPVLLGEELVGTLLVGLPDGTAIDDSDISILETVANQLAVALENACLYQESERLRSQAMVAWEEANRQSRELEERNRQLETAHRWLVDAGQRQLISKERHRIARELHDSVAQDLISIGMNLEWCRQQEPISSAIHKRVSSSKELARSALTQMRAAIFELSALDGHRSGLRQALQDLAEQFKATTQLRVSVRTGGISCALPSPVEHALFHIAQEAMFNVARHAAAHRAWIDLGYGPGVVRLIVADDGEGDSLAVRRLLERTTLSQRGRHRGLVNIQERTRELRGTLSVHARRGGGIRLTVTVPLPSAEADGGADR